MPIDVKQMIAVKFSELLEQKKIEKITVKELVAACNISRQTFYYHFQDMMSVAEYLLEQRLQQSLAASLKADSIEEALKIVLATTPKENRLMGHLLASQRKDEIISFLLKLSRTYFTEMLRAKGSNFHFVASDLEIMIDFYSFGMVGIMLDSMKKERDPAILANQIKRLISGEMVTSLAGQ